MREGKSLSESVQSGVRVNAKTKTAVWGENEERKRWNMCRYFPIVVHYSFSFSFQTKRDGADKRSAFFCCLLMTLNRENIEIIFRHNQQTESKYRKVWMEDPRILIQTWKNVLSEILARADKWTLNIYLEWKPNIVICNCSDARRSIFSVRFVDENNSFRKCIWNVFQSNI